MAPFGPLVVRIRALQDQINQLRYNRRECQQLADHIKAFIASIEEKSYVQNLLDIQQKLLDALTDLYDVLTDIHEQPQLKQILWRDGISILVSRVYEVLNAALFNSKAELDLIQRKKEEARSLDVDHFYDMIRSAQDDRILKILEVPSNQLSQAIITLHQRISTIPNIGNPERQFLNRGLRAMQILKTGIPPPEDAFSMTDFDVVIYHDRELGKGGFGAVFEGNWHGTKVAIKRIHNLHPAFGTNEINIMKRLKHDNVLQIFGANLNSNYLFLVCPLKSQGDVCKFLQNNPSAKRRKLCYDVSLGLAYLHENSVIHGDIKPPNILIDENGVPCLCDFGLSRIRTRFTHAPTTPLDEEGAPVGTFQYMSPEQMRYGITDEASDVYSFGMTIYEIFSGEMPFQDISCWSSLRSHVVNYAKRPAKPQPQDDTGHEFDDKLWSLIEECWSQEPSNRPTAATVSLMLGGVNGRLVNPPEMYKEISALTEELAREKERSKAFETELAKLRNSLERRELEQVELKKDLDKERYLRKQVEKNADESKAARQDLETELANLRISLARREISILRTGGPSLSPNEPMAGVQVKSSPIPDGTYVIKNRAANIYWFTAGFNPIKTVHFWLTDDFKLQFMKEFIYTQWKIKNDTYGNISIMTPLAPGTSSSWVGAEITGSTIPVPWQLIPADNDFYYLTTDVNRDSQNPRVPAAQANGTSGCAVHGSIATLKEGDQWQMWEFIPTI